MNPSNSCSPRLQEFTASSSCSKTVTARTARVNLFTSQLQSTALFSLQLIRAIVNKFRQNHKLPEPEKLSEWRILLVNVRSDIESYNLFYNKISDRYKFLSDILELALDAHVTLVGLEVVAGKLEEPLHSLWLYLLKLAYTKPYIIMVDDNDRGNAVEEVSNAMANFIPENLPMKFPIYSISEHLVNLEIADTITQPVAVVTEPVVVVVAVPPPTVPVVVPQFFTPDMLPTMRIDVT
jgi:hypothetical protein